MSDELREAIASWIGRSGYVRPVGTPPDHDRAWERMKSEADGLLRDPAFRAALAARPDSPTPVIIGTRGHGKPDHCSEHGDIDRFTSMATHKATMHPGVTFYDAEVPGYGTAWSSASPDSPTLDVWQQRLVKAAFENTCGDLACQTRRTSAAVRVLTGVHEHADAAWAVETFEAEAGARDPETVGPEPYLVAEAPERPAPRDIEPADTGDWPNTPVGPA